ncbi:MAG: chemotaxis protein CheW [Limisphaerales bacterium]
MNKFILFEVGGTTYGIASSEVRHIEMMEHVTLVPNANPAIDGVVFSRGQVIPALNLRQRFGLPRLPPDLRTRLVFVQFRDRVVGLIVDSAREFISIPDHLIRPIEETLTGVSGNYLKAVAKIGNRLILLADLEAVLSVDECAPGPAEQPGKEAAPATVTVCQ